MQLLPVPLHLSLNCSHIKFEKNAEFPNAKAPHTSNMTVN